MGNGPVLDDDLRLIVGGNFTYDALGVRYEAILARVHAAPLAYLDGFERLFIRPTAKARTQAQLYLPSFLALVADVAPERVKVLATGLLAQYDVALGVFDHAAEQDQNLTERLPESSSRFVRQLHQRRRQLQVLLGQPGAPP
jgi:hypothetical protein